MKKTTKKTNNSSYNGGIVIEIAILVMESISLLLPTPYCLIIPAAASIRLIILKYKNNRSLLRVVLSESILTIVILTSTLLPLPFSIIVPIITGVRTIILKYQPKQKTA